MFRAVALCCLALVQPLVAGTRIGGVRIDDIFNRLKATRELEAKVTMERLEINKDARLEAYREAITELEVLQKKIIETSRAGGPDPGPLQRLQLQFMVKRGEALTLQREFEEFRARRTTEINRIYVETAEKLLAEIHRKARGIAEQEGYDLVFDTGGNTNTSMPFILHAANPADLTDKVMAAFELVPDPAAASPATAVTESPEP